MVRESPGLRHQPHQRDDRQRGVLHAAGGRRERRATSTRRSSSASTIRWGRSSWSTWSASTRGSRSCASCTARWARSSGPVRCSSSTWRPAGSVARSGAASTTILMKTRVRARARRAKRRRSGRGEEGRGEAALARKRWSEEGAPAQEVARSATRKPVTEAERTRAKRGDAPRGRSCASRRRVRAKAAAAARAAIRAQTTGASAKHLAAVRGDPRAGRVPRRGPGAGRGRRRAAASPGSQLEPRARSLLHLVHARPRVRCAALEPALHGDHARWADETDEARRSSQRRGTSRRCAGLDCGRRAAAHAREPPGADVEALESLPEEPVTMWGREHALGRIVAGTCRRTTATMPTRSSAGAPRARPPLPTAAPSSAPAANTGAARSPRTHDRHARAGEAGPAHHQRRGGRRRLGRDLQDHNPPPRSRSAAVAEAGPEDVDRAVHAARAAFERVRGRR